MAGFGIVNSEWLSLKWEDARNFLKDELESLRLALSERWGFVFNTDNTLTAFAIQGDPSKGRRYVANTGKKFAPKWEKAVYLIQTDDYFISGGPITDVGTISASVITASDVECSRQSLFGGATI